MDVTSLLSTLLGGALAIAGGYVAVVVGERRRHDRERAERVRMVRRMIVADTRSYLLGSLDVQMARTLEDDAAERAIDWPEKARAPRINLGYADPKLLAEHRRVTNTLIAGDLRRRLGKPRTPLTAGIPFAYSDLRARLAQSFAALEERIERDAPIPVMSLAEVRAIEEADPLSDYLAPDDLTRTPAEADPSPQ